MLLKAGVDIGVKKNIVFRWQPPAGHDVSILHLRFISSFKEARRLLRQKGWKPIRFKLRCGTNFVFGKMNVIT